MYLKNSNNKTAFLSGETGEESRCGAEWAEDSLRSSRDGQKARWAEGARFNLRFKRSWEMGHRSGGGQIPVLETTERHQAYNRSVRKRWEDLDPEFPPNSVVPT